MKQNKYHILFSWLLLLIFVAGQVAVYGHQHEAKASLIKVHPSTSQQTVTEKCQLCDAMHFNSIDINVQIHVAPVLAGNYAYKSVTYTFVSLSLILAAGRAPPIS